MPLPRPAGAPLAPPAPSAAWRLVYVLLAAVAFAAAAWWLWWRPGHAPRPPAPGTSSAAPAAPAASLAAEPQLHHPIESLAPADAQLPPVQQSDAVVREALVALLGAPQVASMLQLDGFAHRAVATVDNLARGQAPARLWPVHPSPGRFAVDGPQDAHVSTIAADNADRYRPLVAFAEAVPLDSAAQVYARLYPLFQSAYEELGFPKGYFNDRLVAVLDHLLATPEPAGPLAVQLTQVEGEVPSTRPWVRYEFADPALQALSSGQKLLLRMGPDNARRLKAVLAGVRQRVATGVARP